MGDKSQISRNEMMSHLLLVRSSFTSKWTDLLSDYVEFSEPGDGENNAPPIYLALSMLADDLIADLEASRTEDFTALFQVVERWVTDGEHYVSEAAVVGLLEDLTDKSRYEKAKPADFVRWLGPESTKWWAEVIDFWVRIEEDRFRPLSID